MLKMQDWEFAHRFLKQFARFLWGKERLAREKEQNAPVALLSWATWVNRSQLLFCKERWEELLMVALLFRATWRFAHGVSIKKSDWAKSDRSGRGQTVKNIRKKLFWSNFFERIALLSWATWANCSWSLFNLSDFERKSERANEQMSKIPSSQPWKKTNVA